MRQLWIAAALAAVVGSEVLMRERASLDTQTWTAGEVLRLQAHFDSVDQELRAAPTAALTTAQRSSRAQLTEWLREYRNAGEFPVNEDFPERATPYFRDRHGNLCAMAYLLDRSGRGDVVDAVANSRNNARIHDLADMPVLTAWLDSVGLSVDEAARIQPAYDPHQPVPVEGRPDASAGYTVASVVAFSASVFTAVRNAMTPSRTMGWAGVVTGTAATVLGAAQWNADSDNRTAARFDVGLGLAALAMSTRGFLAGRRSDGSRAMGTNDEASWALQPTWVVGQQLPTRVGFQMSRRF